MFVTFLLDEVDEVERTPLSQMNEMKGFQFCQNNKLSEDHISKSARRHTTIATISQCYSSFHSLNFFANESFSNEVAPNEHSYKLQLMLISIIN